MKTKELNYQKPQTVELSTDCLCVLCSSTTELPGSSTEDIGDLNDFFGN